MDCQACGRPATAKLVDTQGKAADFAVCQFHAERMACLYINTIIKVL